MSDPPTSSIELLRSVLGHVRAIAGDDAFGALLHYGAVQEGRRLVQTTGAKDLADAFHELDGIVGQRSRLLNSPDGGVRLHVVDSPLLQGDDVMRHVLTGLVAGIVGAASRSEQEASFIESSDDEFRGAVIEARPRTHASEVTA